MNDALKKLSDRIAATKDIVSTEEATKTAFIMPFLQVLGYDIFNPLEVVPEYISDVGIKKGEKVDYAICRDGVPAILIECKPCNAELSLDNEGQLLRYYHVSKAEFGVLTNGIVYKFYTDLEEKNKMDIKPFLEINLLEFDKIRIPELEKFCKVNFDAENIRKTADTLKCANAVKSAVAEEFEQPTEELVRAIFRRTGCCGSVFTAKVKDKLTPLVKAAIDATINEKVKANLSSALNVTVKGSEAIAAAHEPQNDSGIVTTAEEIDAHNIIRAIGSEITSVNRIGRRDAKTYCAILLDDNNRKPIARLYFNNLGKLQIGLFDSDSEEKVSLTNVSDIFGLRLRLLATIKKYIE